MKKHGQPFWPESAWRDVVFSVLMIGMIAGLAAFIGPPKLGPPPDPAIIDAYPQPDWYLLWYYAAFALMPPNIEDYVILGGPVLIGLVLFSVPFVSKGGERSPRRRPWAIAAVAFIVMMVGSLWYQGVRATWSPNFAAEPLTAAVVGATSGPVADGARDFHDKGCINCHLIENHGGRRGPDLSRIGSKLTPDQLTIRIINGGTNMPAFAGNIAPQELSDLVAFLASRREPGAPTLEEDAGFRLSGPE
jgi:ubiquinol-cytochrome c reductase cytochrome b subunit